MSRESERDAIPLDNKKSPPLPGEGAGGEGVNRMKEYYIIFVALIIAVFSCIIAYRSGYADGFIKGQSMCKVPVIEMEK